MLIKVKDLLDNDVIAWGEDDWLCNTVRGIVGVKTIHIQMTKLPSTTSVFPEITIVMSPEDELYVMETVQDRTSRVERWNQQMGDPYDVLRLNDYERSLGL